jgi:putative ABC transport system ATP-binding protein
MMALIAALVHDQGVAAIVSTHDPKMAAFADRIIDIHDGRLVGPERHGRHASESEPDLLRG